jgi:outer membrane protein OmpA-like peptidoglycan-associated protein
MRLLERCLLMLTIALAVTGEFCCSSADASDCDKARSLYREGVSLLRFEDRRAAFQKAVDLCPSYAEARVNLADAYENLAMSGTSLDERSLSRRNQLLDKAEEEYRKAIQLKDELLPAYLGLAEIYVAQGRYELAVQTYKQARAKNLDDARIREGLGKVERLLAKQPVGLKSASAIKATAAQSELGAATRLMGFEEHTVQDRQTFNNILFKGYSAAVLPGEPTAQLQEIGKALASQELQDFSFVVEGHANKVDTAELNMRLSLDRSKAVRDYLVQNFGIAPKRLIIQGFGFSRPRFQPETDEKNRRVEIVFLHKTEHN